jgi:hypothetical protein
MIRRHIEHLRTRPEHVRRTIAIGTSFGITAFIAVVWFSGLLVSGNLALAVPEIGGPTNTLAESSYVTPAPDIPSAFAKTGTAFTQLLGAAGVATATTAPAALIIEDRAPSTTPAVQRNSRGQTVIPF